MAERPFSNLAGAFFAVAFACIAAGLWFYILSGGNGNRLRAVDTAEAITGGRPELGREIILSSGCAACHEIPGIPGAQGKIGPSLDGFKDRTMIAGVMANTPGNLTSWIQNPRAVDPQTAMPDLGLSPEQARDVAAYLYAPR